MNWLGWWNLIYLIPGGLGIVFAMVAALGLGNDDSDGELDVEGAVSLMGIGRVPLLTWVTMLLLFYGFIGVAANLLLGVRDTNTGAIGVTLVLAVVSSLALTALFSRLLSRFLPQQESYAGSLASLAGQSGRVVMLISPTEGYAQVRDRFGNLQEVRCRNIEGSPLLKNQPIIVASVELDKRLCLVMATSTDPLADI